MPIPTYLRDGEYFRREISPAYEKLGLVLLAIILLSTYIGLHPLADLRAAPQAQNEIEGSLANQIIGGITGILGVIAVFTNRTELRQVFRKHSIFLLLLAWCAITVIWALNTDVSVRRLTILGCFRGRRNCFHGSIAEFDTQSDRHHFGHRYADELGKRYFIPRFGER